MRICDICRSQDVVFIATEDPSGHDLCNRHKAQLDDAVRYTISLLVTLRPDQVLSDTRCHEIAEFFRPVAAEPMASE